MDAIIIDEEYKVRLAFGPLLKQAMTAKHFKRVVAALVKVVTDSSMATCSEGKPGENEEWKLIETSLKSI